MSVSHEDKASVALFVFIFHKANESQIILFYDIFEPFFLIWK